MRPPINTQIFIRNAKDDSAYQGHPGIANHHLLRSPAGGAFGMVRSEGKVAHQGWDIYAKVNTAVVAISAGTVVSAERLAGYGRAVILKFDFPRFPAGLYALYAHLCQISVSPGQAVPEGWILGYSGTDGNAHGHPPHLHFEIRTINPCYRDAQHPLHHRINPGVVLGGHYRYP